MIDQRGIRITKRLIKQHSSAFVVVMVGLQLVVPVLLGGLPPALERPSQLQFNAAETVTAAAICEEVCDCPPVEGHLSSRHLANKAMGGSDYPF